MFSKIIPWAFFFNWTPCPCRFSWLGRGFVRLYGSYYELYKEAVIRYHRAQLYNLDFGFRMEEASKALVRLRDEAMRKGVDPMDPEYPDLVDVIELGTPIFK